MERRKRTRSKGRLRLVSQILWRWNGGLFQLRRTVKVELSNYGSDARQVCTRRDRI